MHLHQRSKSVGDHLNRRLPLDDNRRGLDRSVSLPSIALPTADGGALQPFGGKGRVLHRANTAGSLGLNEAERKEWSPIRRRGEGSPNRGERPLIARHRQKQYQASKSSLAGQSVEVQGRGAEIKPPVAQEPGPAPGPRADDHERHPGWNRLVIDIDTRIVFSWKKVARDGRMVEEAQYFKLKQRHYQEHPGRLLRWTLRSEAARMGLPDQTKKKWTLQQEMELRLLLPDVDHGAELRLWKSLDPDFTLKRLHELQRSPVDTSPQMLDLTGLSEGVKAFLLKHPPSTSEPEAARYLTAYEHLAPNHERTLKLDFGKSKVLHLGVQEPKEPKAGSSSRFSMVLDRSSGRRKAREALKAIVTKVNEVSDQAQSEELKAAILGIEALLDAHVVNGSFQDIPFDKAREALTALTAAIDSHVSPPPDLMDGPALPPGNVSPPEIPLPPSYLPPLRGHQGEMTLVAHEEAKARTSLMDHTETPSARSSSKAASSGPEATGDAPPIPGSSPQQFSGVANNAAIAEMPAPAASELESPPGPPPAYDPPPPGTSGTPSPSAANAGSAKPGSAADVVNALSGSEKFLSDVLLQRGKEAYLTSSEIDNGGHRVVSKEGRVLYLSVQAQEPHKPSKKARASQYAHAEAALKAFVEHAEASGLVADYATRKAAKALRTIIDKRSSTAELSNIRDHVGEILNADLERREKIAKRQADIDVRLAQAKAAAALAPDDAVDAFVAADGGNLKSQPNFFKRLTNDSNANVESRETDERNLQFIQRVKEGLKLSGNLATRVHTDFKGFGEKTASFIQEHMKGEMPEMLTTKDVFSVIHSGMISKNHMAVENLLRRVDKQDDFYKAAGEILSTWNAQFNRMSFIARLLTNEEYVGLFPSEMRASVRQFGELMQELTFSMLDADGPFMATYRMAQVARMDSPPNSASAREVAERLREATKSLLPTDMPPPPVDAPPTPVVLKEGGPPPPSDAPPTPVMLKEG